MIKAATRLVFVLLTFSNFPVHATVYVESNQLSADLSAWSFYEDATDIASSDSFSYTGAAKSLSNNVVVYEVVNEVYASGSVWQDFGVGIDVVSNVGNMFSNVMFSGHLSADDEGPSRVSGYLRTDWTFSTTQDTAFNFRMANEDATAGSFSFSIFNENDHTYVADSSDPLFNDILGVFDAFNTYTLSMIVDRRADHSLMDPAGDGRTFFTFGIDDNLVIAEPSALILLGAGLAGLGCIRKLKRA
jgi:hypothetical protein